MKIEIKNTKAGAPATKPEATPGNRELAVALVESLAKWARETISVSDEVFRKEVAALFESGIASHVAARLAPVEAERDALRATVAKLEEFQEINDSEFTAEVSARKQAESERDALKRLLTDSVCRIQETDGESLLVKRIMEAL